MEQSLLAAATEQGIWVLLSIALLLYILKKQEKRDAIQDEREKNYQRLLTELSDKFEVIQDIRKDITEIKNDLQQHNKEIVDGES